MSGRGIAARIFLAALASAAVGLAILVVGVLVIGAGTFERLMVDAGDTAAHAREMYDAAVTNVVIAAVVVALVASVTLSIILARRLARPLADVGMAARRVADGDHSVRVPREGPEEIRDLADSFNQMAASIGEQEQIRRDFIANAAHELRTPLTNLQGYLEALRDGVIVADAATYASLWEEADRLVRLSRSLDALAEGDAAPKRRAWRRSTCRMQIRSAVELAEPAIERAGLSLTVEVPDRLLAHGPTRPPCPGAGQPAVQRRALQPARWLDRGSRRTPSGGPAGIGHQLGRGHPGGRPGPRLRALLPSGEVARPGEGWRRHRSGHRQAAGRGGRREGWRRVGEGSTRFWFSLSA